MKFFESKAFKELSAEWRDRLKKSGFHDIEDSRETLHQHDIRTKLWESKDAVLEEHLAIDTLLSHYPEMPKFERRVMEMYSQGYYVKEIVQKLKTSDRNVRNVIKRYKNLVKAISRIPVSADFPHL